MFDIIESSSFSKLIIEFFSSLKFTKDDVMNNILVGLIWLIILLFLIIILMATINLLIWTVKNIYYLTLSYQTRQFNLTVEDQQADKQETILLPIGINNLPLVIPVSVSGNKTVTLYSNELQHSFKIDDSQLNDDYVNGDVFSCKIAIGRNRREEIKHMCIKTCVKA